uniref:Uncharacterized protein n=1 Tax=viral metagenome TaxID=1070528 RepID=A0A6C0ELW9_9ZZZZ
MPKFDIERWDAVIPGNNTYPFPMIYFRPDKDFVKYAEENDYQVLVEIEGTNSIYDGKKVVGTIDSSGYYPNYRPNLYNKTGYFTITLASGWFGYPNSNGKILVRGVTGPDKVVPKEVPYVAPKPIPQEFEYYKQQSSNKDSGLSSSQIGWILIAILIVFCVLLYISSQK